MRRSWRKRMKNKKEVEWIFDEEDGDTHYLIASNFETLPDGRVKVRMTTYETRKAIYEHNKAKRKFTKFLKEKQKNHCSACGRPLPKSKREIRLHHDPPLSKGGKYINYQEQMAFLVHRKCHNQLSKQTFQGHLRKDF